MGAQATISSMSQQYFSISIQKETLSISFPKHLAATIKDFCSLIPTHSRLAPSPYHPGRHKDAGTQVTPVQSWKKSLCFHKQNFSNMCPQPKECRQASKSCLASQESTVTPNVVPFQLWEPSPAAVTQLAATEHTVLPSGSSWATKQS